MLHRCYTEGKKRGRLNSLPGLCKTSTRMTPHRWRMLPLLLAAIILSSASPGSAVFVRFKLLEPTETGYYVQIGGYIHIEPWRLPATVWPAGADSDSSKRVGSQVAPRHSPARACRTGRSR